MNQHEARKLLKGISMKCYEVDPMRIIEQHFFYNPEKIPNEEKNDGNEKDKDFRESTIDYCIKNDIPFQSTSNTAINIVKRLIMMKCPYCGAFMNKEDSGGCGSSHYVKFECDCGIILTFKFNPNEVVRFQKRK